MINRYKWPILLGVFLFLSPAASRETDIVIFLLLLLGLILSVTLSLAWLVQRNKLRQLEQEKMRAELELLKNQVNPHFLFNTLNNLYGLTIEGNKAAPEVILQLSSLLRYTIYEGKKEQVRLQDEVNYLEHYIQLQGIRYRDHLQVNFQKNLPDPDLEVVPLLFITLLENAFKHGVESKPREPFVEVELKSEDDRVSFRVRNNYNPDYQSGQDGEGLKNLRKRLKLQYPGRHSLRLTQPETTVYESELTLIPEAP